MPKIVDHAERRGAIADAFERQVAAHGFAGATYARVAAAADISVGSIQHYFADRRTLLEYAFADLLRRRDARIDAVVVDGERRHLSIRAIMDAAVTELLPLDDDRWREHRVGQQLRLGAASDPTLADLTARGHAALHERVRTAVVNGVECGEVAPGVDADIAAARVLSATYGLAEILALDAGPTSVHRLTDHLDAVLDPVVATVFTRRCRRHERPGAAQS